MVAIFTKTGDKTGTIEIEQGADFILGFSLAVNGTPWDLTGYTIRSSVRTNLSQAGAKVADFNPTWVDQATGKFTLGLSAIQTAAIPFTGFTHLDIDRYQWDLELVSPTGSVVRLVGGFAMIIGEATK